MASVKVAVRVRPFSQRELELESQKIIEVEDKRTRIINTKIPASNRTGDIGRERVKEFSYDFSHWSFDQQDSHYASQEQVFEDLGTDVVENAFEGYNACVFAYGQTGSGKTFTMMGSQESVGLIPRICQKIIERMKKQKEHGVTYRAEVSYLEIYNEKVKDLLKPKDQHNLPVREHPQHGPYVENLSKHLVMDYPDIHELMMKGNQLRTTASTKMNDVSSRSHAIFTLTFVQATFNEDMPREIVSKVNLVDLAGSERADATGATGQRLKEGSHINKSLVTLGSVISSLADLSSATNKGKPFIPYRDSVLTWLLKDSLGGNSKTIMIATISPADVSYGETLSTLRYANRAKNIINKPTINEDPNVKLIRDLRNEIAKLKSLLSKNQSGNFPLVEKLQANEAKVKVLTEKWTERWKETKKILEEQQTLALRKSGVGVVLDSEHPHLVGIDDSVFSTGITFYPLKEGTTCIGGNSSNKKQDIMLEGLEPEHCKIELYEGQAILIPIEQSACFIDGVSINEPMQLVHSCVITLGKTIMFRFNDPAEAAKLRQEKEKGSNLNLSRLSLLSWSSPDLARSTDNSQSRNHYNLKEYEFMKSPVLYNHTELSPPEVTIGLQADTSDQSIHKIKLEDRNSVQKKLDVRTLDSSPNQEKALQVEMDLEKELPNKISNELEHSFESSQETVKIVIQEDKLENDTFDDKSGEKEVQLEKSSIYETDDLSERSSFDTDSHSLEDNKCLNYVLKNFPSDFNCREDEFQHRSLNGYIKSVSMSHLSDDTWKHAYNQRLSHLHTLTEKYEHLGNKLDCKWEQYHDIKYLEEDDFAQLENCLRDISKSERKLVELDFESCEINRSSRLTSSDKYHQHSLSMSKIPVQLNRNIVMDMVCDNVSVVIPSFIIRGAGRTSHYEYEVKTMVNSESWTVYRRYRRFRELHQFMKWKFDMVINISLPSRQMFGSKSESHAEKRRMQLQKYIRALLKWCFTAKQCPLSSPEVASKESLCLLIPFFQKGSFESGKSGTG